MARKTITVSWETRKKIAVQSFWALLVYTLFYWVGVPVLLTHFGVQAIWVTAIQDSYTWFAFTMMSVILGYMGFTTLPFIGKGKQMPTTSPNPDRPEDSSEDDSLVDPQYKFNSKDM